MQHKFNLEVIRVDDDWGRAQALSVMRATYRDEKGWIARDESLVCRDEIRSGVVSWFVARLDQQPVGVLRVLYAPPLDLYANYGFQQVADIDLDAFVRNHRIAEIGRFAVVPEHRRTFLVAVALMREACTETVRRGFSHYITDVFEGERHSPFAFHTRVMGFETVATHDVGELNCPNRRLTMVLSLRDAYHRLQTGGGWLFRYLTESWGEDLHARLRESVATNTAPASVPTAA
jgi:ribosomal protein S18 acetylase RimI-like enzyme